MKPKFNGTRLKIVIIESGVRQYQLADIMGISPNTISRWIGGEAIPSPDSLHRLLLGIGWSADRINNTRMGEFYPCDDVVHIEAWPPPPGPSPDDLKSLVASVLSGGGGTTL